ncbi:hypothetical protein ANN_12642 [Periplaneta americana]|uniref:Uncharacterized protein n=1 Tax=Periplaneta americana TaxID=6978 RepID=A0ABQ8TIJ4_PERAM|nr:hypothetical protein ANN_12642 [Periplaneta americana]
MAGLCEGGNEPPGSLKANGPFRRYLSKVVCGITEFICVDCAQVKIRVTESMVPYNMVRTDPLDTATCTHILLSTDVHIRTDHVRYTLRYLHCFSVVSCPHPSDSALNGILLVESVEVIEFYETDAYSNLDLTKARYNWQECELFGNTYCRDMGRGLRRLLTYLLTLTWTVNMDTEHLIYIVDGYHTQPMITNTLRTTFRRKTQFERGYGSTQTVQTAVCCYDVQVIPYTFSSLD